MNQILICCSILFLVPFCVSETLDEDLFHFEDCGGSHIKFENLTIEPLPIKFSETANIWVSAKVEMFFDLPTNAVSELRIVKLHKIGDQIIRIPFPCIDGDLGSCDMKVCDLIHTWYNETVCPFFEKSGKKCDCPVTKGVYQADKIKVGVPFNRIKGAIAKIAAGKYDVSFKILEPIEKKLLACINIQSTLIKDDHLNINV